MTLCDPTRVVACRHPHDFLSEWCNHASQALARPSLERCSSVHASAVRTDCRCRVLRKPRWRIVILRHSATQTSCQLMPGSPKVGLHLLHTSFGQAVPERLAFRRLLLDDLVRPVCHRQQDRHSHVADQGCFPANFHELSLVSTCHRLLAED